MIIDANTYEYCKSMADRMGLDIEDDIFEYVLGFSESSIDIQEYLWKLKCHSKLMGTTITLEVAKEILHQNLIKKFIVGLQNKLLTIENISVKYLFDDNELNYGGQYLRYDLIYRSLKYKNYQGIVFNVKDFDDTREYKIKLKKKEGVFYISSKYFDHKNKYYKVNMFFGEDDIFTKGKIKEGEIQLHITFV